MQTARHALMGGALVVRMQGTKSGFPSSKNSSVSSIQAAQAGHGLCGVLVVRLQGSRRKSLVLRALLSKLIRAPPACFGPFMVVELDKQEGTIMNSCSPTRTKET
eukprot:1160095-Pelagomonas_calceolata.AAC.13